VRGVSPPKNSKNGPIARWLAGGEEMAELTSAGRKKQRRGGYIPPTWVLMARGEREREREREGAVLVPHVGDSRLTGRQSGRTEVHTGAPVFGR
jgi:hypothetical protein